MRPRVPWNWDTLTSRERAALQRVVATFVEDYNATWATALPESIPGCWERHPGLRCELPVMAWLWHAAFWRPDASLLLAGDYLARYLPAFRSRLDALLGRSPNECRIDGHPNQRWPP